VLLLAQDTDDATAPDSLCFIYHTNSLINIIHLDRDFSGALETPAKHYDKEALIEMACAGGFPEALLLEGRQRKRWHTDNIGVILEHDLADITRIHRRDQMQELIRVLAAWSSKFMNVTKIGSSLALSRA